MVEKGKPEIIKAELCLLAMGFLKPQHPEFGPNVFLAGDAKTGTSLVVRALAGGRAVAQEVDNYLKGRI
jgi:glutamate synthase (NADPH/NADH) small chain